MKLTSYLKVTPASIKSAGLGFLLSAALLAASYAGAQDVEEVIIQGEQITDQVLDDLVSVSAIDAEKLADAGIENVEDVAAYVPNLVLTQSITGTNIFIRGIGSGVNQGFDQSVGLYADGVPLPRANMARSPFLDLAGVQVLRGPQYVLDGNFSIAGSVHMLSNLSLDEFKAGIDLNYQPAQNDRKILLTAGGPINDWCAINLTVTWRMYFKIAKSPVSTN
jgi:iron complex outermembrane receptor protein